MKRFVARLVTLQKVVWSASCLWLSGLFVLQNLASARWVRRRLLQMAGVDFEPGGFFADRGLKILRPRHLRFGSNVSLGHDNSFWCFHEVHIGAWTQTAKDLLVISGSHDIASFQPVAGDEQNVYVGRGCWIGARVTILGGTSLGPGCIVAAGAVVKGQFPAFSIIGGVPAKVLGNRVPAELITSPFGEYPVSELR